MEINIDQEILEIMTKRIDLLQNEINKINRVIKSIRDGNQITESFNDEIFVEDSNKEDDCYTFLARMIEHLLKLKYCSSQIVIIRNRRGWLNIVKIKRDDVIDKVKWISKKRKESYINYLREELQNIYEDGIGYYKKASKEYPDLKIGFLVIPKECPWTLEELMDNDIDDILSKLPRI